MIIETVIGLWRKQNFFYVLICVFVYVLFVYVLFVYVLFVYVLFVYVLCMYVIAGCGVKF